MAERNLRKVSRKEWDTNDVKGAPTDKEIQVGSQQRMADALERSATAHESMAKNGQRTVELHELHLKPKADLEDMNRKFRQTNIALQDELKKVIAEREDIKKRLLHNIASMSHLYRQIAALKGVITRMKKAR